MKHLVLRIALVPCLAATISLYAAPTVRVMTFNASMNRDSQGELLSDLQTTSNTHLRRVTEIIQHLDPDILLINEFDLDPERVSLSLFQQNYLSRPQRAESAITFPYHYAPPSNTGIHSGHDLDGNGIDSTPGDQAYGNDAFGFGEFPEKFAFAVYSKYPIDSDSARTFQKFLWRSMPDNLIPPDHYDPAAEAEFRLSSKSHLDLPIDVDGRRIHILAAHPTPPTFDGAEDRNGRRNHDEIRLFADYITPGLATYLQDDSSQPGGLPAPSRFVIMGDMNADPLDGDSLDTAIHQLLDNPAVDSAFTPMSSNNHADTAVFGNGLRVDYVLPSIVGLHIDSGAVFWPTGNEPVAASIANASDHRPVFLDLKIIPLIDEAVRNLNISRSGDRLTITWKTDPGTSYSVAHSLDLKTWSASPPVPITIENQQATATDTVSDFKKYYRIETWFE